MKTVVISFEKLNEQFAYMFTPNRDAEIYYRSFPGEGWELQFHKNGYYVLCKVTREEVLSEFRKDNTVTDPIQLRGAIGAFETKYLKFAIEIVEEAKEETEVEVKNNFKVEAEDE